MKGFSCYLIILCIFTHTAGAQDQENRGTALSAGTYQIGIDEGLPTIDSAFKKLTSDGISGPVIFELTDEFYQAPSDTFGFLMEGPIPGAGPDCRIILKPAKNKNIIIEGKSRSVFTFRNVSYLTLDGSNSGNSSLTIHSFFNLKYVSNRGVGFIGDSDYNEVFNLVVICDDYLRSTMGIYFQTIMNSNFSADYNLVENNFIKSAGCGIHISSMGINNENIRATGNIIRNNRIGSDKDSLVGWGIQLVKCSNSIIENNTIQNLKLKNGFCENVNIGINDWAGYGNEIRGNMIHSIINSCGYTASGILLSGYSGINGKENKVYNNMIYDIQSTSTHAESRVAGIQLWNQINAGVYYNSVYLSGIGDGANICGSAALLIHRDVISANVINNIFINTRDEFPYFASAYFNYSGSNVKSDHNILYGQVPVRIKEINYKTIGEWQATGNDQNSFSEDVNFLNPALHINGLFSTTTAGNAIPIIGITNDIDGDIRDTLTPDIGADEFKVISSSENGYLVSVHEYCLYQNYPNPFNPSTTIQYQISETGFVTLKIYDILGKEITTLVNEEKNTGRYEVIFNASELSSGVYIYKLKVNNIILSKKMTLVK